MLNLHGLWNGGKNSRSNDAVSAARFEFRRVTLYPIPISILHDESALVRTS